MSKELQKDETPPSHIQKSSLDNFKNKFTEIELETNIHMAPKKEYPLRLKITKIERARPRIDPREFEMMGE